MDGHHDTSFDLLVDIQSYTDNELKALADSLRVEEHEISKKRRIIHAKLDILRAEMVRRLRDKHGSGQSLFGEGDVERLSAILSSRGLPAEEQE
ncbi:MAG: hypothetical protein M5U22_03245 [Thermoleophilia bacterium]|nr:hypothetical protein [Thermoleophilia bacterium]